MGGGEKLQKVLYDPLKLSTKEYNRLINDIK